MATNFVPTEEIRKLTHGSYEHLAHRIDEAIEVHPIFDGNVPVRRIAVFENFAIVAAEDGRFAKVKYSKSPDGSVRIQGTEPISVPVFTEENLNTYLHQEALDIASRFLKGDRRFAFSKLSALLPFIEAYKPMTDAQLVESSIASIQSDKPWKKTYQERNEAIKTFIGEKFSEISSKKQPTKYESLLKDVPEEKLEGFRSQVVGDLTAVSKSLSALAESVEAAQKLDLASKVKSLGEEEALKTFTSFVNDLASDLRKSEKIALESTKSIKSVVQMGKLHDVLAAESLNYEVSSQFVSIMSAKLLG